MADNCQEQAETLKAWRGGRNWDIILQWIRGGEQGDKLNPHFQFQHGPDLIKFETGAKHNAGCEEESGGNWFCVHDHN